MITVVCFLWTNRDPGERPGFVAYGPRHVNTLRSMLSRHLHTEHRLVCVTDTPDGIHPDVTVVPLDPALCGDGEHGVARFPKIALWRSDAATLFGGNRLLYMDLDVVVVDDVTPLVNRGEPLVFTEHTMRRGGRYATPMVLLDAGVAPWIYDLHLEHPDPLTVATGDQAWAAKHLPSGLPVWTPADGVFMFDKTRDREGPPAGSRVVLFSSNRDPSTRWEPWVKEAWT